jgi:alpha-L-rhamnosidase
MPDLKVTHLRCEYLVAPLGLDERVPRLNWQIVSRRRGARQVAYRVRVEDATMSLPRGNGVLWDSGRVESNLTTHIVYGGKPLRPRQVCQWRVEVWDEAENHVRSAPSVWSMGLWDDSRRGWSACWIAADPQIVARDPGAFASSLTQPGTPALFRKEFVVPGAIRRATVYASARGVFELRANGKRIGRDLFAPEWTDYDKRIQYRTYDVTRLLRRGRNVLAATLGDGWWSGFVGWQETRGRYGSLENSLLVQLEVELASGRRLTINTGRSWHCNTGPIIASDFQMGEIYDARRERKGWDAPGYRDENWLPAREVAAPGVPLVAQRSEPVRAVEQIRPVSVKKIRHGVFIYDLGQNIAGRVHLRLRAPEGTRITIRHGERLSPDGTLYTDNLRRAKATDVYICKGRGQEVYEPHFTFHGFQYVEVSGVSSTLGRDASPRRPFLPHRGRLGEASPPLNTITGCVVRSATPDAGHFECSHPWVNRLWFNGLWSQRDNFLSVPTDCPQRDERLGWMGDAQVFLRTATYNMDVAAFFTKWMTDVNDAQTSDGIFPDTAPRLREDNNFVGLGGLWGAAGWADAGIIVPWTLWRVYGDRRIIERHWSAMTRWLDWIERHNPGGLRVNQLGNNYGDWLCIPSDTSFRTHSPMKYLLATAYWAGDAAKMAVMARELGRQAEAERFQAMFEKVRAAFQKEWLREDGRLAVETQTAYLLALAFDLLPENVRARAAEHLVENIRALDWHLSTGFIGISHLNPQLTLSGHADVAYRLLLREDYPSWLYPINHGATTIWERWNGWTEEQGFFAPQMNSFNHYSLGSVGEWLFRHVAGIELDPEAPGFQRFVLRPFIGGGLRFVLASYHSMHGEIGSEWKRSGKKLTWTIRIPSNTSARIYVPSRRLATSASGRVRTPLRAAGLQDAGLERRAEDCSPYQTHPVTESGRPIERATGIRVLGYEEDSLVCDAVGGTYRFGTEWEE